MLVLLILIYFVRTSNNHKDTFNNSLINSIYYKINISNLNQKIRDQLFKSLNKIEEANIEFSTITIQCNKYNQEHQEVINQIYIINNEISKDKSQFGVINQQIYKLNENINKGERKQINQNNNQINNSKNIINKDYQVFKQFKNFLFFNYYKWN
ncbi:unnamed protein product [Paramecium sonneborni]|uniref:Transmembrane protein n=1 Tax=Paramecium sonneborni TaxID=65129 RepID=A0A8S1RPX7_9CILI|nr:unnamed protein product [Paramecium sonneborni]